MNDNTESVNIFPVNNGRQALPYATASLVLGILSIVFCFTYGIIGTILGIIGIVLANKDRNLYRLNPESYDPASYKNSNAGRTCAIIGLILSLLMFLTIVGVIIFFTATTLPYIH